MSEDSLVCFSSDRALMSVEKVAFLDDWREDPEAVKKAWKTRIFQMISSSKLRVHARNIVKPAYLRRLEMPLQAIFCLPSASDAHQQMRESEFQRQFFRTAFYGGSEGARRGGLVAGFQNAPCS